MCNYLKIFVIFTVFLAVACEEHTPYVGSRGNVGDKVSRELKSEKEKSSLEKELLKSPWRRLEIESLGTDKKSKAYAESDIDWGGIVAFVLRGNEIDGEVEDIFLDGLERDIEFLTSIERDDFDSSDSGTRVLFLLRVLTEKCLISFFKDSDRKEEPLSVDYCKSVDYELFGENMKYSTIVKKFLKPELKASDVDLEPDELVLNPSIYD